MVQPAVLERCVLYLGVEESITFNICCVLLPQEVLATVPEDESLHSRSTGTSTLKEQQENVAEVANKAEPVSRKTSIKVLTTKPVLTLT